MFPGKIVHVAYAVHTAKIENSIKLSPLRVHFGPNVNYLFNARTYYF